MVSKCECQSVNLQRSRYSCGQIPSLIDESGPVTSVNINIYEDEILGRKDIRIIYYIQFFSGESKVYKYLISRETLHCI